MCTGVVKRELERVLEEIREFTDYQPEGHAIMVDYLYTARKVANCYDEIICATTTEDAMRRISLLRHHLRSNPQYLDFHDYN